ncbi:MAG: hypothetical protein ACLQLG_08920 [Thermoguttaceae bacterium]
MDPTVSTDHRERRELIRCQATDCQVGTRCVVVPHRGPDGVVYARLLAIDAAAGVEPGEPLVVCPRCRRRYPRMTMADLVDRSAEDHGR